MTRYKGATQLADASGEAVGEAPRFKDRTARSAVAVLHAARRIPVGVSGCSSLIGGRSDVFTR